MTPRPQKLAALAAFLVVAGVGYAPAIWLALRAPDWQQDYALAGLTHVAVPWLVAALLVGLTVAAIVRFRSLRLLIVVAVYAAAIWLTYLLTQSRNDDQQAEFFVGMTLLTFGAFLAAATLQAVWPRRARTVETSQRSVGG